MYTSWGTVTPFVLTSAQQFRPAAPPAVTSARVRGGARRGARASAATPAPPAPPDQTVAGEVLERHPIWNTWNQIAQQVAADRHASLAETTAAFAAMDLALADTTIALYDAKYHRARLATGHRHPARRRATPRSWVTRRGPR